MRFCSKACGFEGPRVPSTPRPVLSVGGRVPDTLLFSSLTAFFKQCKPLSGHEQRFPCLEPHRPGEAGHPRLQKGRSSEKVTELWAWAQDEDQLKDGKRARARPLSPPRPREALRDVNGAVLIHQEATPKRRHC